MIEKTLWHPVAQTVEVGAEPLAARLLCEDLVLWRDPAGVVQAWADRCPHRGARLSLGRLVGEALECPYHGWRFDAGGHCIQVPALPSFVPPTTHRAQVHEAREAHGLVWVRLQRGAEDLPLPAFEAEHDPQLRKLNCGPYDVESSAPRVIENFLDMAHFGFVHEGWLGARELAAIDDYQVEPTARGLKATGCKAWQPKSTLQSTAPAQVEYAYEVSAPYSALLTKVPDQATVRDGHREAIALFICPLDEDRCRVWFRFATADWRADESALRAFQDTIFLQDKPVLESQRPRRLPLDPRAELHTVADRASALYRRQLKMQGITFGVC